MTFPPIERSKTKMWYQYLSENVASFERIIRTTEPQYPERWRKGIYAVSRTHYPYKAIMEKIAAVDRASAKFGKDFLEKGPKKLKLWHAFEGTIEYKYRPFSLCIFNACRAARDLREVLAQHPDGSNTLKDHAMGYSARSKLGYLLNIAQREIEEHFTIDLFPVEVNPQDIYCDLLEQVAFLAYGTSKKDMEFEIEFDLEGIVIAFSEKAFSYDEALLDITDYFGLCSKDDWESLSSHEQEVFRQLAFDNERTKEIKAQISRHELLITELKQELLELDEKYESGDIENEVN